MSQDIQLEIRQPNRAPILREIEPGIYPIGSEEGNKIILPGDNVAPRHAVLFVSSAECWVEDLDSGSGTFVNGQRVQGRWALPSGQELTVGPYSVTVITSSSPSDVDPVVPDDDILEEDTDGTGRHWSAIEKKRSIKKQIHEELVNRLNLKRLTAAKIGEQDLHERARGTIQEIIKEVGTSLPAHMDRDALATEVYDEAVGLGPLESLLEDPEITEVMVNGHDRVYVERHGKLVLTDLSFLDNASVLAIIERIVSPLGRRIDESQPYVDARLKDGSRVNAIIHPLSLVGPCLTIRKFSKTPFTSQDLIRLGSAVPYMLEFAMACVLARKNVVVSGGTGSGKTTLLNVLSLALPDSERIVTIEDAAELRLSQDHVIRLEARPPNIEGRGGITIRDLVRNALRMRPDRIVVGECRGGEALDMLQAMNTGHDGSLTTVHANSPRDVISRLETMVLMSGMDLPVRAIREQVASAIDVIVHESRMSDGSRKIVNISEVVGLEGDRITMQEIFTFVQTGLGDDGRVLGHFAPSGTVPTFSEDFKARGLELNPAMFDPRDEGWRQ